MPESYSAPRRRSIVVWDDQDSSAERFDPSTGTFALAGTMLRPPGLTSPATLLMSGDVLFAGGEDGEETQGVDTAELYDPTSGTSIFTGRMTTPRMDHTSTLLPDGTVLITGSQRSGFDGGGALSSTEVYDPTAASFSAAGNMTTARFSHTATLLADGKVLIVGGMCNACANTTIFPQTSAEIYTPSVLVPAAALLSPTGDGKGQGAIQHADTYQLVTADNPAVAGEIVVVYCTGLADGAVIPPQVAIGGRMAEVLFFGDTAGYPGLNQINVRVPSGVAPGPAVPVRFNYQGRPSNQVTIGVR